MPYNVSVVFLYRAWLLESPGYPDTYPNNLDLFHSVPIPHGMVMNIYFDDSELQHGYQANIAAGNQGHHLLTRKIQYQFFQNVTPIVVYLCLYNTTRLFDINHMSHMIVKHVSC